MLASRVLRKRDIPWYQMTGSICLRHSKPQIEPAFDGCGRERVLVNEFEGRCSSSHSKIDSRGRWAWLVTFGGLK